MQTKTSHPPDLILAATRKIATLTAATPVTLSGLSQLNPAPVTAQKGEVVIDNKTMATRLLTVVSGWLYSYSFLPNGRRQIYHIYQEGDLIGFDDMMHQRNCFSVTALTTARLGEIALHDMTDLLSRQSRLAGHLYSISSLNHIVMMDRLQSIARQNPKARLAHFLLEMANRVRVTSPYHSGESGNSPTFNLPLVQDMVADCVGLTAVHVSRTMTWMKKEGLIARPSRTLITILDEPRLIDLANYSNRYANAV